MLGSPFFAAFASQSVYMISLCSFSDSDPSYDILNLADVANVFVANSIPQRVTSDTSQSPQQELL